MNLADKLYEIIDDRYDRFWRTEGVPKGCYFGKRHQPLEPSRDHLLAKWHGMLRSHGMVSSEEFVYKPGVVCVKDPAILNNEWILVPEEIAFKIVALGELPC